MTQWLVVAGCVGLLVLSNIFMNFAWYSHLKTMANQPLIYAILFSWGIAFFEYMLMIPANRIGHEYLTIAQLKVMQEAITLSVFIPIAILFFGEKWSLDYLWSALCLVGAVYFSFRPKM